MGKDLNYFTYQEGKIMITIHGGYIILGHTFRDAWDFLDRKGKINLRTVRRNTPFEASARIVRRGLRKGELVIVFTRNGIERARCYACCWGHYYNCNRTRIGMYCNALDNFIP